jgi:hypothetical protein
MLCTDLLQEEPWNTLVNSPTTTFTERAHTRREEVTVCQMKQAKTGKAIDGIFLFLGACFKNRS